MALSKYWGTRLLCSCVPGLTQRTYGCVHTSCSKCMPPATYAPPNMEGVTNSAPLIAYVATVGLLPNHPLPGLLLRNKFNKMGVQLMQMRFKRNERAGCRKLEARKCTKKKCEKKDKCAPKKRKPKKKKPVKKWKPKQKKCVKPRVPDCNKQPPKPTGIEKRPAPPRVKPERIFKSMWFNPPCCILQCPEKAARYDDLYYKPSDKDRHYMQTWVSCPKRRLVCKKKCTYEKIIMPKMERRKKGWRPNTACPPFNMSEQELCLRRSNSKCPTTRLPCCRRSRHPPKCMIERQRRKCIKRCTPYPAYSECVKPCPKHLHPIECKCLEVVPMCEVWKYMTRPYGRKRGSC